TRQAGAPGLFASALAGDGAALLAASREAAAALLAADPRLERHPELARAVRARAQAIDAG
ncbi:MAG: hypothetical protein KC636_36865, partial [Myxococcales bacterium]|nr:hypothetical protein [Myxococcales bacterium]